jgi:hypothetical protein
MSIPVLDRAPTLGAPANEAERGSVRLQLIRKRLGVDLAAVEDFRQTYDGDEWAPVAEAAWNAVRALRAAITSIPGPDVEGWDGSAGTELDGLRVDLDAQAAYFGETPLGLTRLELGLLVALARDPRRVYTKAELLRDVWDYRALGRTRTVDSHASRLRRKLSAAGAPPRAFVVSRWGVGYSLLRP